MTWGKMDDKFHRNRKVRELRRRRGGREALGTWVFWWSWCLDDPELSGVVPRSELSDGDLKSAALLVDIGLWETIQKPFLGGDGGEAQPDFAFHDFHSYNPTKAQIENKREYDKTRIAEERANSRKRLVNDSQTSPKRVVPPARLPSRPVPTKEEESAGAPAQELERVTAEAAPANELAERRSQPRDQSSSQRQTFADLIRAEAWSRKIRPAPLLTDNQRRYAIAQVLQYGEDMQLGFELAAKALIAQAFDDSAATGEKFCFAIMDASPGNPKAPRFKPGHAPPDRELSKPAQEAQALAEKLRASGKFF